jgi:hypothetical protein
MENWALANTVTAFATTLSGLLLLILGLLRRHPRRWLAVYAAMLLTGLCTIWYHGTNEVVYLARLSDTGTNLLLAWCVQWAVLGDFYTPRTRLWVCAITGFFILSVLTWMVAVGPEHWKLMLIDLGSSGGFTVSESTLITNTLIGVGLLAAQTRRLPAPARPLFYLLVAWWIGGMLLAGPSNRQIDQFFLSYHALWHIEGAFGFVILWVLNEVRFAYLEQSNNT